MPYFVIDAIPANMLNEVVSTLLVFLTSTNREIVKSTFGFIKLAVHVLPESLMRPKLHQAAKVLVNIKKRKDRAKRKKAHAGDASDEVSAMSSSLIQPRVHTSSS